jgi:catechol 2,3-dioxygenase-like lactoylglutathione lyase family enzyme
MMKLGSMNHLRLTVSDIPRAERFYSVVLGFLGYRLVERSPFRIAYAAPTPSGNLQWMIFSLLRKGSSSKHDRYSTGFHHLALNADTREQVDALHDVLKKIGATVLDAPADYDFEPGYYAVFFADPDGMKLELVHVPPEGSQQYWRERERNGIVELDHLPPGY